MLSVIVPLAPVESEWPVLQRQLAELPSGSEVIVVRAGAEARPMPTGWPAQVIYREYQTEPGRARQQNFGARLASGRWLWFLHADSQLRPECLIELQKFLAEGNDALGWFKLAFRHDGPRLAALNALGANWRSRWLGLPFGDQGLVLPRRCFEALQGFDEHAVYGEDHLLVWAARHAGLPLHAIPAVVETSARKYAQHGWLRTTLQHAWRTTAQAWLGWRNT